MKLQNKHNQIEPQFQVSSNKATHLHHPFRLNFWWWTASFSSPQEKRLEMHVILIVNIPFACNDNYLTPVPTNSYWEDFAYTIAYHIP
jgi:hypothetical protein